MALKPTIYKFRVALTDMNREYYDSISLTVAQHPSENIKRMMARVLAFCLNAHPELKFTKGLSTTEEPDIWHKAADEKVKLWIEVGEPDLERIKKASRIADNVLIYSFNNKTESWWKQNHNKLKLLDVGVHRFSADSIENLTTQCDRTMDMSVMITGNSVYVSTDKGDCEVVVETLKEYRYE
ncbi:YaeQ family protein [Vibrio sp. JC009]|uniref:YaeQ family protein n=1 Tax=Vibrio sp. JC009 TaxID=2912314 RepID=UPI0023B15913|nr:YaeQ family protein [Vibrio sp. JC009]WED24489.1 YaeQ family protein [Vibrio sp. JC009]